jgi:hypothetical protein
MHHVPETRPGAAARAGRRLLLLLAVAACGGGGDAPPRAEPADRDVSARADTTAGTGVQCAPSPAVNPALLSDTTKWARLTSWRVQSGVAFADANADSTRAWVRLCAGCNPVKLRIVSENRTYCNSPGSLHDTTRIAGVWAVEEGTVTPPGWGVTFSPGDSIFVFAHDTASSAILAYRVGNRVHRAPANAWSFHYCQHGGPGFNQPRARWRDRGTDHVVTVPGNGGPPDVPGPPGDSDPPGTYGWMACASGCCQFYIPPILEEDGDPPGKGGGSGGGGRPMCPGRHG